MIPHSVGKCRGATKGTLSRQEPATNEVSRLRDCLGSLEKGAGSRRLTEGFCCEIIIQEKISLESLHQLRWSPSLFKGGLFCYIAAKAQSAMSER